MTDQASLFGNPSPTGQERTAAPTGEELKERGIAQVLANEIHYPTEAIKAVERMPIGAEVTGEDIRAEVLRAVAPPHHPNVWGGSINAVLRTGLLEPTGEWRSPRDSSSHARPTRVYRVTGATP